MTQRWRRAQTEMKIPCSVCRIHGIPQIDLWERRKFKVKKVICLSCRCPHRRHHRVLSWRFGSENWLCHSCHFNPQWSIVREHGGVNCPHSVPANQREYIATQIHAAHIHYLCPGGKPCPDFFKKEKKKIYPSFWPYCVKILFCIIFHRSKPRGAN